VSRSLAVLPAVTGMLVGAARLDAQQGHTMFRADPAHRGVYEAAPVTTLGGLRWRFAADGPVRSTPAIFDGVVYVGSGDGSLHAIDLGTGEGRWEWERKTLLDRRTKMIGDRTTLGAVAITAMLALLTPSPSAAQDGRQPSLPLLYTADVDHSSVGFSVLHVGITRVRGLFDRWSAALTWDGDDRTRSSVTVVIDPASLDTNSDRRDADLRSDNFFHVERFPTAVFQSTAIRRPEGGFQLIGRLRIKDRVQTVTIAAASLGDRATERSERRGFEGSLTVLRKDFGVVNEGNILERMGVIGKDVEIEIQLSALRLKPEGRAYRDREEARSVGAVLEEVLDAEGIDAAVARYRTALEDDGHSLEMGLPELVTLGSRLVLEGRATDAARILAVYVAHQPEDAEGRFWLGEMLAEAGERDAAIEQYRMALDLDPLRADAAERIRYLTDSRQRAPLVAGSEPR